MATVFEVLNGPLRYGEKELPTGQKFIALVCDMRDLMADGTVKKVRSTSKPKPKPIRWRDAWRGDNFLTMPWERLRCLHRNRTFHLKAIQWCKLDMTLEQVAALPRQQLLDIIKEKRREHRELLRSR